MNYRLHMLSHMTSDRGFPVQMNSFIIETVTGEIVVFDGGYRSEWIHLLEKLQKITGKKKPEVAGWFLSHPHCDHIDCFMEIIENHSEEVEIKKVYYNFPSIQFIENSIGQAREVSDFYQLLPRIAPIAVIATEGDRYEIGGAIFDVLYSTNPAWTMNGCNNSSLVVRATLGTKTIMFLGDLGMEAGNQIFEKYGADLKSDYCQMAHHGQQGVGREVYEMISPEVCLWSTPLWLWNNDSGQGYNTGSWKTLEVRQWMEELGVERHYVSKDGDQFISIE